MIVAASDYPLGNALWTMFVFFAWIIWIWLLFTIFADLFRRSDVSGWGKAGWTVFVLVVPFIGVFVYLVAEGKGMSDRRMAEAQAAQQNFDTYVRSVATTNGHNPTAEIQQAKQLLDSGAITQEEFDSIKQKALAG